MNTLTMPKTLHEAMKFFADPEVCHEFAVLFRWAGTVTCPYCGGTEHSFISTRKTWACKSCKKRFTVKVGTIMEDSPLKLETWFSAMWLIGNAKNGISSCEVARALGITQKTGWFLLHRIRHAMQVGSMAKFSGVVEADETYIGGLEKNKHKNKREKPGGGGKGKQIVMGILERGTEDKPSTIKAKVIRNTKAYTLAAELNASVEPGSELMTDAHGGYRGMSGDLKHQWVDHAVKYAEGSVHTNGVENFWSLFQRMFGGTYTHIDPQHLQAYINELAYRFNARANNDAERFVDVLCNITGKRLTYAELIQRGLDTMMPA